MPAYRSASETEIRDAVVAHLRQTRPGFRIMHEINAAGQGTNRIDVMAVGRSEIVAVEIKSEKDKIDRLPAQIEAMRGMAHHVIAALHEKFLVSPAYRNAPINLYGKPPEARGATEVWVWPIKGGKRDRDWGCETWLDPKPAVQLALPLSALDILWHAELIEVCAKLRVSLPRSATRGQMMAALRWGTTGGDLTKAICAGLRQRACIEADPPMEDAA